jgi:glucose-6-phosphate dehydrogenase assembly protein OpcA
MMLDVHPLAEELTKARHGSGAMNTATMTFAVFFADPGVAGWVGERTRLVAEKHPSRVLLFDGSRAKGDQRAKPSETRGEWVEIGCKDSSPHELQAALAMLELPEAPLVLAWLGGAVAREERFLTLARMASTVVVSSSLLSTDANALVDLTEFVESHPEIGVQDIAYLRLAAWQELVAEFFDEPEFLAELERIREVEVTAGSDPEMYYLLGWLASRLAWAPCAEDQFCNSAGDTIAFTLTREGAARRLSSVVLKSAGVTFTASVHPDDDTAVCLEITGAKQRERRCAPLHTLDIASLIERAILRSGRDEVFIETLTVAKEMLERRF